MYMCGRIVITLKNREAGKLVYLNLISVMSLMMLHNMAQQANCFTKVIEIKVWLNSCGH